MTAVEWFVDKLMKGEYINSPNELIEQAKQMEKEQIMKAVYDSMGTNFDPDMGRAELYNETYGK